MTSIELQGSVFDILTVRWLRILRPEHEQNSCQFRGLEEPRKLTYFTSLSTEQSAEQRAAIAAMDDKTAFKIDMLVLQRPFSSTTTVRNEQKWHFGGDFLKDAGVTASKRAISYLT